MFRACWAPCPARYPMTDPHPLAPALRHMDMEQSMFQKLSEFQQSTAHLRPVAPQLRAVLSAALPAFELGFSYTASHWNGELTVTLHFQGAELGSSATASIDNYGDTCARLLAGLLGIPLMESWDASEPEEVEPEEVEAEAPAAAAEPEPQEEDEEFDEICEPEPSADIHRILSEQEKATAVDMVKAMAPDRRRAFTKTFREVFNVPADAKQIVPFIAELQHLHFIDRYTVEASGGVAA